MRVPSSTVQERLELTEEMVAVARRNDAGGHEVEALSFHLVDLIEDLFRTEPAEHWLERLAKAGVPAGKVRTLDDVYSWEQTLSQGLLLSVQHPTQGELKLPGSPIRFDDNTFSGGRSTHLPPPTLGQHNDEIRAWLQQPR